jgi:hypothetical protein
VSFFKLPVVSFQFSVVSEAFFMMSGLLVKKQLIEITKVDGIFYWQLQTDN